MTNGSLPFIPSPLYQPEDAFIESFINPDGSFNNSICLDTGQNAQIPFQRHVDLRCFIQNDIDFPNDNVFTKGEHWTVPGGAGSPTIGIQSSYNHHYGMTVPFVEGINPIWSITTSIDIASAFVDQISSSFISLACPAWPSEIDPTQSYIDFTSDPEGSFGSGSEYMTGPVTGYDDICSLLVSQTIMPTNTEDVEIRINRSHLTTLDQTAITGIRLRIWATGSCTFTCLAIRMLPATWDVAPVDINTRLKALVPPVTRAGTLGAIEFPVATNPDALTPDWPILYRQTTLNSSLTDIDNTVRFYTGEMTNGTNEINLFYRVISNEGTTQGFLDDLTMGDLDGFPQPDTTNSGTIFGALNMQTLDTFQMNYLDTLQMQQLDAIPTSVSGDWLEVDLSWSGSGTTLIIQNRARSFGYTFNPTLSANTYYLMLVSLVDTSIHLQIWETDASGSVRLTQVLDSTAIDDPEVVIDRIGTVGWYSQLTDGNAACYGLVADYTSFGSYLSTPIQSQTPVVGASIYPEATPDLVLTNQLYNGLYGGIVTDDISKSFTAKRITVLGGSEGNQGAQSNPFWVYDWNNTVIQFRLFASQSIINNPLQLVLINQDYVSPFNIDDESPLTNQNNVILPIPFYSPGVWQNYTLYTEAFADRLTGYYSLNFIAPNFSQVFWIDNFLVFTRNYAWFIRNGIFDYNPTLLDRTTFYESHGNVNLGASLDARSTSFQISAEQLQANTEIQGLAIMPYYANRNKLVWDN